MIEASLPKKRFALGALLRWLGIAIAVLCVGFVLKRLSAEWALVAPRLVPGVLLVALGCVLGYLLSGLLLSYAWYRLVRFCGGTPSSQFACHVVYGTTQIGKYLPGNVFHFVGRQMMGRRANLTDAVLALSSLLEIALFPTAATLLALGAGGPSHFVRAGVPEQWVWVGAVAAAVGLVASPWLLRFLVQRLGLVSKGVPLSLGGFSALLLPIACYATFLLISVLLLGALLAALGISDVPWALLFAGYPVVWVVGFLIPGASGGIGVREALLVLLFAPALGDPVVLTAATLLRGVTLSGELLWFLLARAVGAWVPPAPAVLTEAEPPG